MPFENFAEPLRLLKSGQVGLGLLEHGLPVGFAQAEDVVSFQQKRQVAGGDSLDAELMDIIMGAVARMRIGCSRNESRKSTTPAAPATGKGSIVSVTTVVTPLAAAKGMNAAAV